MHLEGSWSSTRSALEQQMLVHQRLGGKLFELHIKTTQCRMSNLSNLFLKNFQGVRLIQNFIGQAQRESRLTKAVEHQEIPQIQL